MKGAREYADLFETGQYGRCYFVSGEHARGKTFEIYVLPAGEVAIPNGSMNPPLNNGAVCVYGVVSGQPGWTEYYGWLRNGLWQDDFHDLVRKAQAKRQVAIRRDKEARTIAADEEEKRISCILSTYPKVREQQSN